MRTFIILLISLYSYYAHGQLTIELEEYASGFNTIVKIASNGLDERLYVVERKGVIKVVETDGTVLETPFLDINDRVFDATGQSERGLLGLAFHPDFETNGYFYVNYTDNDGDTQVTRFQSDTEGYVADSDSEDFVIGIPQPFSNHNGGDLAFGPDGYLYIGTGDGGSGDDPLHNGQNRQSLLGKMLRIDIDQQPYGIPEDNPYAADDETLDEIWALGLRNPWRFSFDQETGDLWIGDVGQNRIEEIDFQSADSPGGENYGWRCYEGTSVNSAVPQEDCIAYENTTPPFFEYTHTPENHCSITGGYVYRGCTYPELHGYYLYADVCTGYIWGLKQSDTGEIENIALLTDGGNWTTFGQSMDGQLYIAGLFDGIIYKITSEIEIKYLDLEIEGDTIYVDTDLEFDYRWYDEDGIIEGATDSFYIKDGNINLYVEATHNSGCIYTGELISIPDGTHEIDPDLIRIMPNPFFDHFIIDLSKIKDAHFEITLLDRYGRILRSTKVTKGTSSVVIDDIEALPSGVFFIQIKTEKGKMMHKVVK